MARPWLLLDVDGPLNPYQLAPARAASRGYELHQIPLQGVTYPVLLNPGHGVKLLELTDVVELAWATTWEHQANRLLAPLLGLPDDLPVIEWPPGAASAGWYQGCWKTPYVARWVGDRPFAWVDDDLTRYDRAWLAHDRDPASFLLRRIAPDAGLTRRDFTAVRRWAEGPGTPRGGRR
jgi:hypothetical protein